MSDLELAPLVASSSRSICLVSLKCRCWADCFGVCSSTAVGLDNFGWVTLNPWDVGCKLLDWWHVIHSSMFNAYCTQLLQPIKCIHLFRIHPLNTMLLPALPQFTFNKPIMSWAHIQFGAPTLTADTCPFSSCSPNPPRYVHTPEAAMQCLFCGKELRKRVYSCNVRSTYSVGLL